MTLINYYIKCEIQISENTFQSKIKLLEISTGNLLLETIK